jgi:hypothetical protein
MRRLSFSYAARIILIRAPLGLDGLLGRMLSAQFSLSFKDDPTLVHTCICDYLHLIAEFEPLVIKDSQKSAKIARCPHQSVRVHEYDASNLVYLRALHIGFKQA